MQEAELLKEYDHPNIVSIIGVVPEDPMCILMEYCSGGDYLSYMRLYQSELMLGHLYQFVLEVSSIAESG